MAQFEYPVSSPGACQNLESASVACTRRPHACLTPVSVVFQDQLSWLSLSSCPQSHSAEFLAWCEKFPQSQSQAALECSVWLRNSSPFRSLLVKCVRGVEVLPCLFRLLCAYSICWLRYASGKYSAFLLAHASMSIMARCIKVFDSSPLCCRLMLLLVDDFN